MTIDSLPLTLNIIFVLIYLLNLNEWTFLKNVCMTAAMVATINNINTFIINKEKVLNVPLYGGVTQQQTHR